MTDIWAVGMRFCWEGGGAIGMLKLFVVTCFSPLSHVKQNMNSGNPIIVLGIRDFLCWNYKM